MQKIGIDIDNVIADTIEILLKELNKHFKTKLTYNDIYMYDFEPILGISKAEAKPFFIKLFKKKALMKCRLMKGAREALNKIKRKYKIYIVTSRLKDYEKDTIAWIDKMKIPYDHIEHVTEKQKHLFAAKKGIRIFIEDDLEQAIYMAEAGIKVYIFDHPWNKTKDVQKRFVRVKCWKELLSKI